MPNPNLAIALLLGGALLTTAWFAPRFALIPCLLLFLWALSALWGMTEAIPRSILEHHSTAQPQDYLHGYRDGVIKLSERLSEFSAPILKLSLLAMTIGMAALSLKHRIKSASP